jgi:hypothetical protein
MKKTVALVLCILFLAAPTALAAEQDGGSGSGSGGGGSGDFVDRFMDNLKKMLSDPIGTLKEAWNKLQNQMDQAG